MADAGDIKAVSASSSRRKKKKNAVVATSTPTTSVAADSSSDVGNTNHSTSNSTSNKKNKNKQQPSIQKEKRLPSTPTNSKQALAASKPIQSTSAGQQAAVATTKKAAKKKPSTAISNTAEHEPPSTTTTSPTDANVPAARKGMFKLPTHILHQALNIAPPTPPANISTKSKKKASPFQPISPSMKPVIPQETVTRQPRAGVDYPKSRDKKKDTINMEDYIDEATRNEMKLLKHKSLLKHLEAELDSALAAKSSLLSPDAVEVAQQTLLESYINILMLMITQPSTPTAEIDYIAMLQRTLDVMQRLVRWWTAFCSARPQLGPDALIAKLETLALLLWNVYHAMKNHPTLISTVFDTPSTQASQKQQLCSQLFAQLASLFTTSYFLNNQDHSHLQEAQYYLHLAISLQVNNASLYYQRYLLFTLQQQAIEQRTQDISTKKVAIVELIRKRVIALLCCQVMQSQSPPSRGGNELSVSYHEVLTELLEHAKHEASSELTSRDASSRSRQHWMSHYYHLHLTALICIAMIYTRVDVDKCTDYIHVLKTQVVMTLQLVTQSQQQQQQQHKSAAMKGASWLDDEDSFQSYVANPEIRGMMKKVEDCCYDLLLTMLLLLQYLAQKHRLAALLTSVDIVSDASLGPLSSTKTHMNDIQANNLGKQHLVTVQCSGGVVDTLRCIASVIAALVFGSSAAVSAATTTSSMQSFQREENHTDNTAMVTRLMVIGKAMHLFAMAYPKVSYARYLALLLPSEFQQLDDAFLFLKKILNSKAMVVDMWDMHSEVSESFDYLLLSSAAEDDIATGVHSSLQRVLSTLPEDYSTHISAYEAVHATDDNNKFTWSSALWRWQHTLELCQQHCQQLLVLPIAITANSPKCYLLFDQQRKARLITADCDAGLHLLNSCNNASSSKKGSAQKRLGESAVSTQNASNLSITSLPKRVAAIADIQEEEEEEEGLHNDLQSMQLEDFVSGATTMFNTSSEALDRTTTSSGKKAGMLSLSSTTLSSHSKTSSKYNQVQKRNKFPAAVTLPLVVLDAANVAMRHGLNQTFSCAGIQLAMRYFLNLGHKVIAFLPDYYMSYERVGALRKLTKLSIQSTQDTKAKIPDNIALLESFVQEGLLVCTPPQDYDDDYCIDYAQRHCGYVVTNDLYRDYVQRQPQRDVARSWVKERCVSFTFVGNEFIPNPQAKFMPYSN